MALLHAPTEYPHQGQATPGYNELHLKNFQALNGLSDTTHSKWMYLIGEQIQFTGKIGNAIRLAKPNSAKLFDWMEKIVQAGQCSVLFVENLLLDDFRTQKLSQLCEQHCVTLVNLTVDNSLPENVVVGPWH